MKRYFVIIGAMRTGSNLLEKTLAALGDTICYGEVFNPAFIGGPRKTEIFGWNKDRRDGDPLACLQALISAESKLMPGFRVFDGHTPEVLRHVLTDPGCARIILRRNHVESYVSLKIARETDQWMLKRPERRLRARIRFDPQDFNRYVSRLEQHYAFCDDVMSSAGQEAIRIDYEDLSSQDMLRQIATHIGSMGAPPREPPLIRQNPGHLSTKVENYEEMCVTLGIAPTRPSPQSLVSRSDVMTPRHLPVAFAPIPGPAVLPTVALLQRIEARSFDQPQASRAELIEGIEGRSLFRNGQTDPMTFAGLHGITVVCHPVRRALGLFAQTLFSPSWRGTSLRHGLTRTFPDLRHLTEVEAQEGDRDAILRQAFTMFLAELAEQPHVSDHASRHASQASVLNAFKELGLAPKVIKLEDFMAEAGSLTADLKVDPVPPGQVVSIYSFADGPVLDALAFPEAAHLKAIGALWSDDYRAFGYQAVLPVAC